MSDYEAFFEEVKGMATGKVVSKTMEETIEAIKVLVSFVDRKGAKGVLE